MLYALIGMRLAIVVMGSSLAVFAFFRYIKGGYRGHLLLALGFSLISLGALVEGVTIELMQWELVSAHAVEAAFSAAGLLSVLLAIVLGRR